MLKASVANVRFKCFECFRGMLQVFYIGVAIIYRDVAHVAMYVSSVCSDYFICFILQIFYLDGCIYICMVARLRF
jgi:hypothetical protein